MRRNSKPDTIKDGVPSGNLSYTDSYFCPRVCVEGMGLDNTTVSAKIAKAYLEDTGDMTMAGTSIHCKGQAIEALDEVIDNAGKEKLREARDHLVVGMGSGNADANIRFQQAIEEIESVDGDE